MSKKKLLKSLIFSSLAVSTVAAPVVTLTSCNNEETLSNPYIKFTNSNQFDVTLAPTYSDQIAHKLDAEFFEPVNNNTIEGMNIQ